MKISVRQTAILGSALALVGGLAGPSIAAADSGSPIQHVLIISINGLHQTDAIWFVDNHPRFLPLLRAGVVYPHAQTPVPSDPYAAMVSQLTGGSPGTTGVYGADTYDHSLVPARPGSASASKGAEVDFTGALDKQEKSLDAGQGLDGLPDTILHMTGTPQELIDPAKLPVDPTTGALVTPNRYVKVNNVFEVAHSSGLRTAWVGDHPSFDILDGPSGTGVDDLFTPEINSKAPAPFSGDWAKYNAATRLYDNYKAQAVLNEIDGFDHSGTSQVGAPAIFGVDFDSVAVAQELAASYGEAGGYENVDGQWIPGPLLQGALEFLDSWLGRFVAELAYTGLTDSTTIILTGTNGQSPTESDALTRIAERPIIGGLDQAWAADHPSAAPLVAFSSSGDALQLWLSDRSVQATSFAKEYLASHPATGTTITGATRTLQASGTADIFAGADAATLFGVASTDPRHPDLFATVQHGVVYNADGDQVAGQGGADTEDRAVPLIILDPSATPSVQKDPVNTTQIAPTILSLLGLDPSALQAVQAEHTAPLPGA